MSKPDVNFPDQPDPAVLSAQQGENNVQAAIATALLNQQNQVSPFGTVNFDQTGSTRVGEFDIPSFTRTTTLSPEQQQQLDLQNQLGVDLSQLSLDQTGRISGALGSGIDTAGLPGLRGNIRAGTIQGSLEGVPLQDRIDTSGLRNVREDFGTQGDELRDATFQSALGLLSPEFARQNRDAELLVTNRGLPLGSESAQSVFAPLQERQNATLRGLALDSVGAGRGEQSRLFQQASQLRGQQFGERSAEASFVNQAANDAFAQALNRTSFANQAQNQRFNQGAAEAALSNAARAQGFQEAAFNRNLPINDIAALLGTAPGVQGPQFQQTPNVGVAAPDLIGATLGVNQQGIQQAQIAQQAQSGLLSGLLGLGSSLGSAAILGPAIRSSDKRLKSKIRKIGKTIKGFNLYRYIRDGIDEIGVIAQEVIKTAPDAVSVGPDGFYRVDYGKV